MCSDKTRQLFREPLLSGTSSPQQPQVNASVPHLTVSTRPGDSPASPPQAAHQAGRRASRWGRHKSAVGTESEPSSQMSAHVNPVPLGGGLLPARRLGGITELQLTERHEIQRSFLQLAPTSDRQTPGLGSLKALASGRIRAMPRTNPIPINPPCPRSGEHD